MKGRVFGIPADVAMDLLLAMAGAQWSVQKRRCACGCGQSGQAVRQAGPSSCVLLGHRRPKTVRP